MSTGTQQGRQAQTVTADQSLLDATIAATQEQQRSITKAAAAMFGCSPAKVYDLCRNFWPQGSAKDPQPPLTNAECWTGLALAVKYGLDPAAREIYVIRHKGRIMCAVGIDGWVKILDRTEGYNGFEQTLEFEGEKLVSCETVIYSTKRDYPAKYRAYLAEYREMAGFVFGKMPSHMLRVFSLRHAARLFTPLGAYVVTEEEAKWMNAYSTARDDEPASNRKSSLIHKVKHAADDFEADAQTGTPANLPGESEASSPETTAGDARAASPAVSQRDPGDDDEPEPSSPQARRLAALAKCRSLKEIRGWWKSFDDEHQAGLISQAENIELVNAELARKCEIEGRLLP